MFSGSFINHGTPVPATIAFKLANNDEWIVGVKEGNYLKMVKLRVTGANTYDWISTKYRRDGSYDEACVTSFSESCFVGPNGAERFYPILLEATRGR